VNFPPGALTEEGVRQNIRPLFSEVLARDEIYLANHSLGRPLDQTRLDVAAGLSLWYRDMDEAWDAWMGEMSAWRAGIAELVRLDQPDAVVPRASCGQALRAVLNSFPADRPVRVVTTDVEFDSIDFVLRSYHETGRAEVRFVASDIQGGALWVDAGALAEAVTPETDLVVVSAVVFMTGQIVKGLDEFIRVCHSKGAKVMVDAYHAVGVLPFSLGAADFAMGGSYKYLRGGPGCCWLAIHPCHLGSDGPRTVDTGWFAKEDTFGYGRPDSTHRKAGGDAWLESTPAVLPFFQARAGLNFTRAVGVERLRGYGLELSRRLRERFLSAGLPVLGATDADQFGAFVCVRHPRAAEASARLKVLGLNTDARGAFVRFGPDLLTTEQEISRTVEAATVAWA